MKKTKIAKTLRHKRQRAAIARGEKPEIKDRTFKGPIHKNTKKELYFGK